jgi:hypothetical protein
MQWTKKPGTKKPGEEWSASAGSLSLELRPKGDGRWNWQIFNGNQTNPMAAGVASSLGAAKTVAEQFAKRSGSA